jgi:hypothetical protein
MSKIQSALDQARAHIAAADKALTGNGLNRTNLLRPLNRFREAHGMEAIVKEDLRGDREGRNHVRQLLIEVLVKGYFE